LGSGCGDATDVVAALFVAVCAVIAFVFDFGFEVPVLEGAFEVAFTPFACGPALGAIADAFLGGIALMTLERIRDSGWGG
jgi:hypothetical protein